MLKLCEVRIGVAVYWMSLNEATPEAASALIIETEGDPPEETPTVKELPLNYGTVKIRIDEDDGSVTKRSVWEIHNEQTEPTIIGCSEW